MRSKLQSFFLTVVAITAFMHCLTVGDLAIADEPQIVELKDVSGTIIGELNLGAIQAGSQIERKFKLQNSSTSDLNLQRIKPSCQCTSVVLPMSTLQPGQHSSDGTLKIQTPDLIARDAIIAELAFVHLSTGLPIASVKIRASIDRPFYVRSFPGSFVLGSEEYFEQAVPVVLGVDIVKSDLAVSSDNDAIDCSLRENSAENQLEIVLRGRRSELLDRGNVSVEITHEKKAVSDSFYVRFIDGTLLRTIPAQPEFVDGNLSFILYRQAGVKADELCFRNSATGDLLEADLTTRSPQLVKVDMSIPPEFEGQSFVIEFKGSNLMEVPILKKAR